MPSILQINIFNNLSTGTIAEQIGKLVLQKGWNSYFAYSRGTSNSESQIIRIGHYFNVYVHVLETRFFDNHGLASRLSTKKLIKQIEEISPDIVHLHNIHGYYINYKLLFDFLKKYDHPVVWTLHDCWAMTGHCCYFSIAKCYKWQTQCCDCPLKNDYPKSYLFDHSKQNFILKKNAFTGLNNLHVVSVSNWLNEVVKKSYLNYANLHIIHNGVDLDVFRPYQSNELRERYNILDKVLLLGVASTWARWKGFDDYIELRKHLSDDYVIVLIGLENKIIKTLPKGIIGICRTENQIQLAQWYSEADIILNLSYQESFGLTTVEGFACGTPSIVYNTTASPELITDTTGLVVDVGNISQLVEAITQIRQHPLQSKDCRQRATAIYDKNIVFQKYMDLYENILSKSPLN